MRMDLTLRLRTTATPEADAVLRETVAQYTESFNRICVVGWEMPRLNGVELHHQTYAAERGATALPSQLVCSARPEVQPMWTPGEGQSREPGRLPLQAMWLLPPRGLECGQEHRSQPPCQPRYTRDWRAVVRRPLALSYARRNGKYRSVARFTG